MTRRTTAVTLTVLLAAVAFTAGILLYQRGQRQLLAQQASTVSDLMVRPHSPVIGPATAPVTIVEFFDPACEACRAFYPYVKDILAAYPQEARLVIRYVPFHGEPSTVGVRILEAARAQELYEPVMEALLLTQPVWADHRAPVIDSAWTSAQAAGLDVELARAYIASGAIDPLLEQDVADLEAVGVTATPTFFVNGQPLPTPDPRVLLQMVRTEVERARR